MNQATSHVADRGSKNLCKVNDSLTFTKGRGWDKVTSNEWIFRGKVTFLWQMAGSGRQIASLGLAGSFQTDWFRIPPLEWLNGN